MPTSSRFPKIAVLDDYQGVALSMADWGPVSQRARVTVFKDHLADADDVVRRLEPFDGVCVMRERTPLTREILRRLPKLRVIASTGTRNASIDSKAAVELGIEVLHTTYMSAPTIEMTWALILSSARHVIAESRSLRRGRWQTRIGVDLSGKTLGVLGLGSVGGEVARIGAAFGMKVVAWSQNLTDERARACGATLVTKEMLFRESDFVSIHLVLSDRTRGLVGHAEFAVMKPSAYVINTSRGPIVMEAALIDALAKRQIAGAAVDVYDQEPLPADHPFRKIDNLLATPHIGYVSQALYQRFYGDVVRNLAQWLECRR